MTPTMTRSPRRRAVSVTAVALILLGLGLAMPRATAQDLCDEGVVSSCGNVCCNSSCGSCGGCDCANRPGGASQCCPSNILFDGIPCIDSTDVGCVLDASLICVEPGSGCTEAPPSQEDIIRQILFSGALIQADLWDPVPQILAADYAFEGIVGFDAVDPAAFAAAGAAVEVVFVDGNPNLVTTGIASAQLGVTALGDFAITPALDDALPVVFSWPIASETLRPGQFQYTLNDGSVVTPVAVTMVPNIELNERNVVVTFGQFGNRIPPGQPGSLHPVLLTMVEDDGVALELVGIDFTSMPPSVTTVSTLGMTYAGTSRNAYRPGEGPRMIKCKLTFAGVRLDGEGASPLDFLTPFAPNDEVALFGPVDGTRFVVRGMTNGGFSPDGLSPLSSDAYETSFRLLALRPSCSPFDGLVPLIEVGVEYTVCGGTVTVLGLSDLGPADQVVPNPLLLVEDNDNFIDIVFTASSLAAAQAVTALETPTSEEPGYTDFFNPGGPGPNPIPGIPFSEPGPRTVVGCSDETAAVFAVSRAPVVPLTPLTP